MDDSRIPEPTFRDRVEDAVFFVHLSAAAIVPLVPCPKRHDNYDFGPND